MKNLCCLILLFITFVYLKNKKVIPEKLLVPTGQNLKIPSVNNVLPVPMVKNVNKKQTCISSTSIDNKYKFIDKSNWDAVACSSIPGFSGNAVSFNII